MAHCHMPSRRNARAGRDAVAHSARPEVGAPVAAAVTAATDGVPSGAMAAAGAPTTPATGLEEGRGRVGLISLNVNTV
eukprot:1162062-Pelagomonas_calceolata.AAC.10